MFHAWESESHSYGEHISSVMLGLFTEIPMKKSGGRIMRRANATLNGYSTSSKGRVRVLRGDDDVCAPARLYPTPDIREVTCVVVFGRSICGRSLFIVRRADRAPRAARVRNRWRRRLAPPPPFTPFVEKPGDDLNCYRTTEEND